MKQWIERSKHIQPIDAVWREIAQKRLDEQTRPRRSLGQLEIALQQLVAIQKTRTPELHQKQILIFACDHGVEAEGVSAYPKSVTEAMVLNFLNGGATINVLARHIGAEVRVVDVGVDADLKPHPLLVSRKVRRGTRNMTQEPAMTFEELDQALTVGWDMAEEAKKEGVSILVLGEMGIGNTTAASAVVSALLKVKPELVTGRGTGIDDDTWNAKVRAIEKALHLHQTVLNDPLQILEHVGGYEIAAMTGALLGCAHHHLPVIVDGWVVSASTLAAAQLNPSILDYVFFGHESEEKGHRIVLEALRTRPIIHLGMRLGEGSGAALALGILEAAVRIYNEVATFDEAQVAKKKERSEAAH